MDFIVLLRAPFDSKEDYIRWPGRRSAPQEPKQAAEALHAAVEAEAPQRPKQEYSAEAPQAAAEAEDKTQDVQDDPEEEEEVRRREAEVAMPNPHWKKAVYKIY